MISPVSEPKESPNQQRACPLCHYHEADIELTLERRTPSGDPYRVVRCRHCSLLYTRPFPSPGELESLYTAEFYGAAEEPRGWDRIRKPLHHLVLAHRRKALLGRAPGRILDIGCGDGDFLADLKKRGWEVYGTDYSMAAVQLARGRGIDVRQGELAAAAFPDHFFDAVTMWHVVEHLPEPHNELREVDRILKPEGLVAVEVPNAASPTYRICRDRWAPLDVPRHVQHFVPETLDALFSSHGFRQIARQDFHWVDFALSTMSFMERSGVLGRRHGAHYFVSDFQQAPLYAKALFLALLGPVTFASIPYSALSTLLTANSETMTVSYKRATA